jgi:hypothetical protein
MHTVEHARPIPGLPEYEITSDGRIFSKRNPRKVVEISRWKNADGYLCVTLQPSPTQKITRRVHQLVLLTYRGPKPSSDHICRHLNGCRTDNRVENLAWGTVAENAADQVTHGTASWLRRGIERPSTKLTDDAAREIAARANRGEDPRALADEFGISLRWVTVLSRHEGRAYLWAD